MVSAEGELELEFWKIEEGGQRVSLVSDTATKDRRISKRRKVNSVRGCERQGSIRYSDKKVTGELGEHSVRQR